MNKRFEGDRLRDFNFASSLEWIETNGLGGYASSTVSGANSRRYHGLLIAAMHPPVGRTVVLSKLEETIVIGSDRYELSSNQYPEAIHPQGFGFLTSFQRDLFPEFTYQVKEIRLRKTIAAVQGENSTLILYEVIHAHEKFTMEFLPLCSARDFHSISHANDALYRDCVFDNGLFQTKNYVNSPELFISIPNSQFEPTQHWYHRIEYIQEQHRGLDCQEDLFNHGKFRVELKKGERLGIIVSTTDPKERDPLLLFEEECKRKEGLVREYSWNEDIRRLVLAADQFIVKRRNDLKTIIAGYHWFSDWGRDAMISLPGLCLATKRYEDAKKILRAFAGSVSEGMLPNRFPDQGESPEYNTVDATLWFFLAIYTYYEYAKDKDFIQELIPMLEDIIRWHDKGTRYNIHVDEDELLSAGQSGVQLTWMDAKVGDWVVTPRRGKAVEINALWYNALAVTAALLTEAGNPERAGEYKKRAVRVKNSFNKIFWNERLGYLYDYVDGERKNDDLRPNQIYAISLPFQLLPKEKAEKVFAIITQQLYTSRGLRTLSPKHPDYKRSYQGDQRSRDSAYHQGTVWSFLLGPYIDALMKLQGEKGRGESARMLKLFFENLNEAGIGTISEIFDGAPPHHPRGCIAQAWGVGEVLRVALEYELFSKQKKV